MGLLGWGRLTGKCRRHQALPDVTRLPKTAHAAPPVPDERTCAVMDTIDAIAKDTGKTVLQLALNWLLPGPTVSTLIVGARNEPQLIENLGAVGGSLTTNEIAALDATRDVTPVYPYWHQRQTIS